MATDLKRSVTIRVVGKTRLIGLGVLFDVRYTTPPYDKINGQDMFGIDCLH